MGLCWCPLSEEFWYVDDWLSRDGLFVVAQVWYVGQVRGNGTTAGGCWSLFLSVSMKTFMRLSMNTSTLPSSVGKATSNIALDGASGTVLMGILIFGIGAVACAGLYIWPVRALADLVGEIRYHL